MAGLSRRSLLKTGGAAAAGVALLSSDPLRTIADAAVNPQAMWCEVLRVNLPAVVYVRPLTGPVTPVSFPHAATDPSSCNRDGVLGLGAFQPGDEAVIELLSRRQPLVGVRIDTCYRHYVGRIVSSGAGHVVTTQGEFWLPSDARLRFYGVRDVEAPRSALKSGVNIDYNVRFEPSHQRQLARFVVIGVPT